jgi:Zn ribbon nucleic-acid-binding protein
MSQASKGKLNYRCPACFVRDIDIDMFYDDNKKEYYCLRCGFVGNEKRVLELDEQAKFRYRFLKKRVVDFNDDNKPLIVKDHTKGEM